MQATNLLISSTAIEVNCENADGFTPLDLLSGNERNLKDKEIVDSLRRIGAVNAKDKPLSNRELKAIRAKILSSSSSSSSTSDQTNAESKPKKNKLRKRSVNRNAGWVERKRDTLMVVASLLATMAFQAGVNPPGGLWQDTSPSNSSSPAPIMSDHTAGFSIMADNVPDDYNHFLVSNTTGFLASLSIILLLISGLPLRHRFFMWILMVIMWAAISAMAYTYLLSISAFTPGHRGPTLVKIIVTTVLVWIGLMLLLLLGHTIRVIIRLIKCLVKLVIRYIKAISAHRAQA